MFCGEKRLHSLEWTKLTDLNQNSFESYEMLTEGTKVLAPRFSDDGAGTIQFAEAVIKNKGIPINVQCMYIAVLF